MSSFLSKLKLKVSKNHLRQTRNSLWDNLDLIKYQVGKLKTKINPESMDDLKYETTILDENEKKKKYEEIISNNTLLSNIYPFKDNSPKVSIILTNKNGVTGLKRILTNFKEDIQYPSYELLLIDNELTEDSTKFLNEIKNVLPVKIIDNLGYNIYSKRINHAVNISDGEYVLLLNSDLKPTYGWLNQMVQTVLRSEDVGVVGAKLVYSEFSRFSFKIHQIGIEFKEEPDGSFRACNMGEGLEPFDTESNSEIRRAAFSANTLMVKKDIFLEVNGLEETYNNGYEGIDLCLKVQENGYKNILSPNALLFYYKSGTELNKNKNESQISNLVVFNRKWGQYLSKNLLLDKLQHGKLLTLHPMKIAFTVSENGEDVTAGDYFTALEFGESLQKLGWQTSYIPRTGPGYWYELEEDVDVLISLLDMYDPRRIKCSKKSLIKIAWPRNWFDRWVSNPGFSYYEIVCSPSKTSLEFIKEKSGKDPFLLPIATNPERFNRNISKEEDYVSDYCFTGSYWNDQRDIMEMLDPEEISYNFKLFGKNWDKITKFKKYYQGFINYSNLPKVYASTKIVIDDANRATKKYGSVNSRVYDAIASGALVLTNSEKGSKETFNGKLPVFRSKKELNHLINYYLSNNNKRINKVNELEKIVLENHTYKNRANTLKQILKQYLGDIN